MNRLGYSLMVCLLMGCGVLSRAEFEREYPAATSPMIFANSRILEIRDKLRKTGCTELLELRIEATKVQAKLMKAGSGEIVQVTFDGEQWTKSTEKTEAETGRSIAMEAIPFERLSIIARKARDRLMDKSKLGEFAKIHYIAIKSEEHRMQILIEAGGTSKRARLKYEAEDALTEEKIEVY